MRWITNIISLYIFFNFSYKHAIDGLIRVARTEGIVKLFNGAEWASSRAVLVTVGQLCFYDVIKAYLLTTPYFQDNLTTHFTSSLGAVSSTYLLSKYIEGEQKKVEWPKTWLLLKIPLFVLSLLNLLKIIISWVLSVPRVLAWLEQNCGFFINRQLFAHSTFFYSPSTYYHFVVFLNQVQYTLMIPTVILSWYKNTCGKNSPLGTYVNLKLYFL